MDKEMQTRIRDLILDTVPEDGSTIGNVSLFREVQQALEADGREYDDDAVKAVREQLIAEDLLGKGRGRGGSVYRKAAAAGIGEELLFRGFLQSWLAGVFGTVWPALLVATVAFGAVHWVSAVYFAYATLLGAVLGLIFWMTGDLLAPVLCHAVYDVVALLVSQHRGEQQRFLFRKPVPRKGA